MTAENGSGNAQRRVVITGIGPISASGIGVERFWEGLHSRHSPVAEITHFDASPFRTHIGVEIPDFEPAEYMDKTRARRLDRFAQMSLASTRIALEDADLEPGSLEPSRVAVQMGSALGGLAHAERQVVNYHERGVRGVDARLATMTFCGAASCQTAIEFGFTGPNSTNAMSCASGTIALGDAFRLIRDGVSDVAVGGGIEAPLSPVIFGAFAIIRAMSQRNDDPTAACRPFDKGRDGFVMGEGACVFVLEEESRARARGARIYAEIRGYGNSNDAHHMTAPRPDGQAAVQAIRSALDSGGLEPEDVDHVNAHGSSTPLNDSTESQAIRLALGEHADRISVTGTKPFYGHALGASGALETAIGCLAIQRGWVPPTVNLEEPGEGCDLDYVVGEGREQEVRTVLTNSFGFGGINAVLILSAPREAAAG